MTSVIVQIIEDAKKVCGVRIIRKKLTIIFDRGGYSALIFEKLIAMGVDIITYNRGTIEPVDLSCFEKKKTIINNREYDYTPYNRDISLAVCEYEYCQGKKKAIDTGRIVEMREILVRRKDDGITSIITTDRKRIARDIASDLFSRWSQENYLKYMIDEFALDHLCTYGTDDLDPVIDHPNPEYIKLNKEITKCYDVVKQICGKKAELLLDGADDKISAKIIRLKKSKNGKRLKESLEHIEKLKNIRKGVKERVSASDYKQLKKESHLFSKAIKIFAYHIESELASILMPYYKNNCRDVRKVISSMLKSSGVLKIEGNRLIVTLEKQSSPARTRLLQKLCDELNCKKAKYPSTDFTLCFETETK